MNEPRSDSETSARRRAIAWPAPADYLLAVAIVMIVGLWIYTRTSKAPGDEAPGNEAHVHPPGAQGGVIISLARDRYHAEALVEQGGVLRLLTLGPSATEVIDVQSQALTAYVDGGTGDVIGVPLFAEPQAGDRPTRTSQFVGQLPAEFAGMPIKVTITTLRIDGQRYRLGFAWPPESHLPAMPDKVQDEAERQLYLQPGGLYTAADIEANEGLTASEKFVGFKAKHDFNPQPGDLLCPITQTKANPDCDWIIGGHRYTFCCPPCIDEFVELAKRDPDKIQPPEAYVK